MPFRPLNEYIAVRLDPMPEPRIGSIIIPDEFLERAQRNQDGILRSGMVVAVGKGDRNKRGRYVPCDVQPGERIAFPQHQLAPTITVDGEELLIIHQQFVYGSIVEPVGIFDMKPFSLVGTGAMAEEPEEVSA